MIRPLHPKLYAHTPWSCWEEYLPYLCKHQLAVEFYLSSRSFEQIRPSELEKIVSTLKKHTLSCTLHAPSAGMDPGSNNSKTKEATHQCVMQTLRLAQALQARSIVFHSGFSNQLLGTDVQQWADRCSNFWTQHLPQIIASDNVIALENVYEKTPALISNILESVKHQRLRHCFDIGHFNIHATVPLTTWLSELGKYCVECHLHDNNGSKDEHLPIGKGTIDFKCTTDLLKRHTPAAIWTLEAHSVHHLEQSLQAIKEWL